MVKTILGIFILLLVNIQVFSQRESEISCDVRHVESNISIDGHQIIYCLPKNLVRVTIKVNFTTQVEGPYAAYAEKYLNITEGVIQSNESYYELTGSTLERYCRPDSLNYYSINYTGNLNLPQLQLSDDGIIIGCNVPDILPGIKAFPEFKQNFSVEPATINFTDLGVIPFVEEKTETFYKTVQTDSTPTRVPYEQTKIVPTTEEKNAKEAADFIRKLRKRRLKLLIGLKDETFAVDGEAMKTMVKELSKLENKYLELFIGKSVTQQFEYSFDFEPDVDVQEERQIIAWFSPTLGISNEKPDLRKNDFKPITVFARTQGNVPKVKIQTMDNSGKSPVAIKYGLYYRIPALVSLNVSYIDKSLVKEKMLIAQKGVVASLPVEYINSHKYSIEFNPELGSIRRISENTNK